MQNGTFPLWNPYLTGGTPRGIIAGAPGLYPFNWLIALFPVAIQMYIYFGAHLAMGGSFMYGYLRRISCSKLISFLASIMYVFTVHMGGLRKEHTTLIVAALYVPVVLYFAEQYLQKRELKWLFCCSGAMALQFLGGFLQYVVYADIAMFFYLLTSGIHHKFSWKQIIRDGILWIAAYFGMCMAAILGTAQFMLFLSGASGSQMPFEGFIYLSLHPIKLLMTILP